MINEVLRSLSPIEIVALTLIGESRGEPIEGQVAVGNIIRNRFHNSKTNQSYTDVCLAPKQFSCWNQDDPNYPVLMEISQKMVAGQVIDNPYYRQCLWVASGIVNWNILDNTFGNEYYMTKVLFDSDKRPSWAKITKKDPIQIGRHVFFDV